MNRHVNDSIAAFVCRQLPADRLREVEAHLSDCASCAEEATFARELHCEALRQGLRHLGPMRVVELGAGAEPDEPERDHLAACDRCRAEIDWARSTSESRPRPRVRAGAWVGLAAAAALTAVLLVPWGESPDLSSLAVVEPLPVRITRSAPEAGSFEEARLLSLEAYAASNHAEARVQFARCLERRPDDAEILLYLGSSELLSGNPEAAVVQLRRAVDLAESAPLRDEALWQLANAALVAGRPAPARSALDELASREGRRSAEARRLRDSLQAAD